MPASQRRHLPPNIPHLIVRAQAVFFAGLFALVLPFICWGAWAQPCHPHSRPHFVFLPPVLTASVAGAHNPCAATQPHTLNMPMAMPMTMPMTAGEAGSGANVVLTDADVAPTPTAPASQSMPTMSLAVFSLILLLTAVSYRFYLQWEERSAASLVLKRQHFACVPTPPPRLTSI